MERVRIVWLAALALSACASEAQLVARERTLEAAVEKTRDTCVEKTTENRRNCVMPCHQLGEHVALRRCHDGCVDVWWQQLRICKAF